MGTGGFQIISAALFDTPANDGVGEGNLVDVQIVFLDQNEQRRLADILKFNV